MYFFVVFPLHLSPGHLFIVTKASGFLCRGLQNIVPKYFFVYFITFSEIYFWQNIERILDGVAG